jgi:hypothetical protein
MKPNRKREMYENFHKGLVSDDFSFNRKSPKAKKNMYYAMYAFEEYGDATRDNSFEDLVELGRELEETGGKGN